MKQLSTLHMGLYVYLGYFKKETVNLPQFPGQVFKEQITALDILRIRPSHMRNPLLIDHCSSSVKTNCL